MTVLPLVKDDIHLLTQASAEFDFETQDLNPSQLARDLVDTMYASNGLGLSACQIGLPYRVFAMRGSPENLVLFNPKIVQLSSDFVLLEETSLSFPGLIVEVNRPKSLRMRFTGPDGEVRTVQYTGMTARIVQHQMDHLDGKLFYNKTTRHRRDKAFKNRGKNG
jgi:peptide deformylase